MSEALKLEQPVTQPGILANRKFLLVSTGCFTAVVGENIHNIAIYLWILQTTGSAKMMSVLILIQLIMNGVFSSFAGTFVDRMDRRKIMYLSDFLRAVVVLGIAACIFIPGTNIVFVFVLTGLTTFISLFHAPAWQSSITHIVDKQHIQKASGMLSVLDNLARIAGMSIGGILIAWIGGGLSVCICAITLTVSGIFVLLAGHFPSPVDQNRMQRNFWADFKEGLTYIAVNKLARSIVIISPVLTTFYLSSLMLVQVMLVNEWKATSFQFGFFEACLPIGYMIGAAILMKWDQRFSKRGFFILGGMLLLGPVFIILSLVPSAWFGVPLILIHGFLFSLCAVLATTLLRLRIDEHIQGRVFALLTSFTTAAPPLGIAICSFFADAYSASNVLTVNGMLLLLVSILFAIFMKSIRHVK